MSWPSPPFPGIFPYQYAMWRVPEPAGPIDTVRGTASGKGFRLHGRIGTLAHALAIVIVGTLSAGMLAAGLATPVGATPTAAPAAPAASASSGGPCVGVPSAQHPLAAADYFGIADPNNFWSSDLSGAAAAFRQIRANGFNAVGLVVPWGDFEPGVDPVTFNQEDFARLDQLVTLAGKKGLCVILRLGYSTDPDPADQMPWGGRDIPLWGNKTVYQAWLDYLAELHQNLEGYDNVGLAYISWEDYWGPVWRSQEIKSVHARIQLAQTIGYQKWLRGHFSLSKVSRRYGTTFSSWSQVPTPLQHQPAAELIFEYFDYQMVNRFLIPGEQRFPGLTLEARIDPDTIYNGSQPISLYYSTSTWDVAGTSLTGMYFAPFMRDPSTAHNETASEAMHGLRATLSWLSGQTGGRRLFMYEFLVHTNSGEVKIAPKLTPNQIRPFLDEASGPISRYTDGYAVWTYRDFDESPVYNPSFSLGTVGWKVKGSVVRSPSTASPTSLTLSPGAEVSQSVSPNRINLVPKRPATVSVTAESPTSGARLRVQLGVAPSRSFALTTRWTTFHFTVPASKYARGRLQISGHKSVSVTNAQVYDHVQQADIYGTSGAPKVALAGFQVLNKRLTGR
jgi:hypothetical protein